MTVPLDELDVELLLQRGALDGRPDLLPLGTALAELDAAFRTAEVVPSDAIAALVAEGATSPTPLRRGLLRGAGVLGSVGLGLKVAVGTAAATATLVVAGAAGMLPDPAQDVIDRIVHGPDRDSRDPAPSDDSPRPDPTDPRRDVPTPAPERGSAGNEREDRSGGAAEGTGDRGSAPGSPVARVPGEGVPHRAPSPGEEPPAEEPQDDEPERAASDRDRGQDDADQQGDADQGPEPEPAGQGDQGSQQPDQDDQGPGDQDLADGVEIDQDAATGEDEQLGGDAGSDTQ